FRRVLFRSATFAFISKVLGFLSEVLIASRFGSSMETDTYFVAMTATVIVMGSIGGALNTTLITIFSEIKQSGGREAQKNYLNNILNLIFLTTVVLGLIAFILSPMIIRVLAKGFEGGQFN